MRFKRHKQQHVRSRWYECGRDDNVVRDARGGKMMIRLAQMTTDEVMVLWAQR
jgi:hypothetical protein